MSHLVEIESLCKHYPLGRRLFHKSEVVRAVEDVSLTIPTGQNLGLVGESGCGKSTLGRTVLRLTEPTSGLIRIDGVDVTALRGRELTAFRRHAQMIFQDPFTALNPVMRIRDQMAEIAPGGADALARVQLDPVRVLSAYPHQLSGGQRQRVMIAMALLSRPDLVLADEPTTALDMLVQKEVLDLLFRLQKEMKMAILLISHNLPLVAHYTQRLVVMKEGAAVETGPSMTVLRQPQHPYTQSLIGALRRLTKVI
mgnify:CR=1 FL=1